MVKFSHALSIVAVLILPQLILAAPPAPQRAPQVIAQLEATVDYCVRMDAPSADQYKEVGKAVVADMSEKELEEVRGSTEYKQSYGSVKSQLDKIQADKAVPTCHAAFRNVGK